VADKEVLSIVEMTQRSRAMGNQYGARPLGFDWSLLQKGISAVIEDPSVKQKPSPRITLLNETQGDETWQIG